MTHASCLPKDSLWYLLIIRDIFISILDMAHWQIRVMSCWVLQRRSGRMKANVNMQPVETHLGMLELLLWAYLYYSSIVAFVYSWKPKTAFYRLISSGRSWVKNVKKAHSQNVKIRFFTNILLTMFLFIINLIVYLLLIMLLLVIWCLKRVTKGYLLTIGCMGPPPRPHASNLLFLRWARWPCPGSSTQQEDTSVFIDVIGLDGLLKA